MSYPSPEDLAFLQDHHLEDEDVDGLLALSESMEAEVDIEELEADMDGVFEEVELGKPLPKSFTAAGSSDIYDDKDENPEEKDNAGKSGFFSPMLKKLGYGKSKAR